MDPHLPSRNTVVSVRYCPLAQSRVPQTDQTLQREFHYQQAVLVAGEIGLEFLSTEEQAATIGTYGFTKFCNLLGIDALETRRQPT